MESVLFSFYFWFYIGFSFIELEGGSQRMHKKRFPPGDLGFWGVFSFFFVFFLSLLVRKVYVTLNKYYSLQKKSTHFIKWINLHSLHHPASLLQRFLYTDLKIGNEYPDGKSYDGQECTTRIIFFLFSGCHCQLSHKHHPSQWSFPLLTEKNLGKSLLYSLYWKIHFVESILSGYTNTVYSIINN